MHDYTFPPDDALNRQGFELILSPIGEVAQHFWLEIPNRFPAASLDKWVIMPDHIHGLIKLGNGLEASQNVRDDKNVPRHVPTEITRDIQPLKSNSLSSIINHFKGNVKRWYNQNGYEEFFWQSRFYDHILRNDQDLIRIHTSGKTQKDG